MASHRYRTDVHCLRIRSERPSTRQPPATRDAAPARAERLTTFWSSRVEITSGSAGKAGGRSSVGNPVPGAGLSAGVCSSTGSVASCCPGMGDSFGAGVFVSMAVAASLSALASVLSSMLVCCVEA